MAQKEHSLVFGPVPSRRLGLSLGVDLVPFKTCSYDCIYCQLGRTTRCTIARNEYVPIKDVSEQLRQKLSDGVRPDHITVSGSGEPTLHSRIGKLIESVKKQTSIPVAVLTNGSLLWDRHVQEAVRGADLVLPSLDAGDSSIFKRVNRPHPDLNFGAMVEGLMEFRRLYRGKIWLEVFLLGDVNATTSDIAKIKRYVEDIRPDKIQLNTVVRPPAEDFALKVPLADMTRIRTVFGEHAEVIAPYGKSHPVQEGKNVAEDVLALLRRRPCTLGDIANGLGMHRNEVLKHLSKLEEQGLLREVRQDSQIYYHVTDTVTANPSSTVPAEP